MVRLVLLPQGGLGNQLIQFGYAQSLASRTDATVEVNPLLLGAAWARLRGVSFRPLSPWLMSYWPELQGRRRCGFDLLLSKACRLQGRVLGESSNDLDLIGALLAAPEHQRFWMLGYYQRRQAFSPDALPLWRHVATKLMSSASIRPHPKGQVALHVRLGDYLLPQNQRLFAQLPVKDLVERALSWRDQLGGSHPISLFTDTPALLTAELEKHCSIGQRAELQIQSCPNPQADFLALIRYRHILASNSTFSLCAGHLSWLFCGESSEPTLLLPPQWYCDEVLDHQQRLELEACQFTTTSFN